MFLRAQSMICAFTLAFARSLEVLRFHPCFCALTQVFALSPLLLRARTIICVHTQVFARSINDLRFHPCFCALTQLFAYTLKLLRAHTGICALNKSLRIHTRILQKQAST